MRMGRWCLSHNTPSCVMYICILDSHAPSHPFFPLFPVFFYLQTQIIETVEKAATWETECKKKSEEVHVGLQYPLLSQPLADRCLFDRSFVA